MSKPLIIQKSGAKWEVLVDLAAARRFHAKVSGRLKEFPSDAIVKLVKTKTGLGFEEHGPAAKFSKGDAEGYAHTIGARMLGLGDFAYSYTEERREPAARDPRRTTMRRRVRRDPGDTAKRARLIREIYKATPRDYRTRTGGTHNVMLGERESGGGHGVHTLEKLSTSRLETLAANRRRRASRDPRHRHRTPGAPSFAKQRLIARKIRRLRLEGYPPKQAEAIAYRYAGVPRRKVRRR